MSRAEDQTRVLLDAATMTPPCTCDATGEQPHAKDCPRAKRMHQFSSEELMQFVDAAAEEPDETGFRVTRGSGKTETIAEGLLGQFPDVNIDEPSELTPDNATRVLPRSAVEIAMEQTEDTLAANVALKADSAEDIPPFQWLAEHKITPGTQLPGNVAEVLMPTRINENGNSVPDLRSPAAVAIGTNPFIQKREALQREMVSSKYALRRRGRMIPERGRMVVARVEWDEKIGSIFMLDGHKKQLEQSNQEAVIMACGPLRIDPATGKEVPMRFSIQDAIGKHIVIREHSGIEFVTHDENGKEIICYWIGQSEIWGWLEPYPGDEANSPEIWKAIAYLGEETAKEPE